MDFFTIFLLFFTIKTSIAHFEFDNVKCVARDPSFSTFEYCFLKSVNRTYKYLSLKSKILQLPVDNCKATWKLAKRNSKSPFEQLGATFDGCRYMRERNNPVVNLFFNSYKDYTNINHTCPYDHDIYLDKLPVHHMNNFLSGVLPEGRYYSSIIWIIGNITRAEIIVFFTKS